LDVPVRVLSVIDERLQAAPEALRITAPAAGVVGFYGAALRRRLSLRLRLAFEEGKRLAVDLDLLEVLLRDREV
jgi:hypothetical protein